MRVVEQFEGVFLRLALETKEEQRRYAEAYQIAAYSGFQVQQTMQEPMADRTATVVGLWIDDRLAEPFRTSVETGTNLKELMLSDSVSPPSPGYPKP